MSLIVPRTATEIRDANTMTNAARNPVNAGRSLESHRSAPAYVLLGDPGAGKTTAFKRECDALGEAACFVTARDFLTFDPDDRPEWRGRTLFIDGLDECRAGSSDRLAPFDRIRRRLAKLGNPCFRLSCRTADWLGDNDRQNLTAVTPDRSAVAVLRLDPLTDSDASEILEARADIPNVSAFIRTATDRGIDALLRNPQNLCLLAAVVATSGTWPETRLETFELACRHLAAEHNQDRRHVAREPAVDCALEAAGRLCAILILSGCAGYAPDLDYADADYLNPDRCADDRNALRQALSTKLFTAETEGRLTPVHRHLADFLGARHLAWLIAGDLPARRVLALITGEDGTVVTEQRGLSAWLAALCPETRSELVERDPIGVVSYGDVRKFTASEKRMLLSALSREASRLRSVTWTPEAVGALATRDMESVIRDALTTPAKEPYFAALVLLAITHGTPLPGLADFLFDLVCQRHRWAQLPCMMLDAFIHNCTDRTARDGKLARLLTDLTSGRVSDWNNELLGTILTELYPRRLASSEIWDYLSVTAQRYASGPYHHFWHVHLVENASNVAALLDSFASRRHELKHAVESLELHDFPLNLLARGIEEYGDTLDPERLCKWLLVDMFPDLRRRSIDAVRRIRSWLQRRPHTLQAVIAELASSWTDPAKSVLSKVDDVDAIRYGADFPPDYGLWCLRQAAAATNAPSTPYFLYRSCRALADQRYNQGLTLEVLFELTQGSAHLRQELEPLLRCDVPYPSGLQERRSSLEEREQNHGNWIAHVRSNVAELRSGTGSLDTLYWTGKAYFGSLMEARGGSPDERIRKLFRDEEPLIEAALAGMRSTLSRNDVPDPVEIISISGSGQEYRVALPFLAGMEEIEQEAVLRLNDRQVRQALAFRYGSPALRLGQQGSQWYRTLLDLCPETVADVLVHCIATILRRGKHDYSIVHQLLMEDHARVARHAAMPLLRGFPLRCTAAQLQNLDDLLHAANRYCDRRSFLGLIAKKLTRPSMTIAQRIHWLAMGVIVRPDCYLDPLKDLVQRRERRISHLAEFLRRAAPTIDELTVPALEYYISLLGSTLGRWISRDSDIMETESSSVAPCIYEMVQRLAVLPDPEASAALDALTSDPSLASWDLNLITARDRQRVIRRDALYRHPTGDQVCNTLRDGPPANPGDLAALVTDRLDEIAVRIRTDNTDDWRQYWNVDQYERPVTPKPENSCRDAILSDLRQRLPAEVDAQPEGRYANDGRADIRVACNDFHVPIEIKRDSHRELWSAIRNQLIERYVSDPATGGHGIYLVFWFGTGDSPLSPRGVRPARPDELRERLTAMLSEEIRRRTSVCVVDVSPPSRCP